MKYLIGTLIIGLLASCGDATGNENEKASKKNEGSEKNEEKQTRKIDFEYTTYALYDSIVYLKRDMSPVNALIYGDRGDVGVCINGKREGVHRYWYENLQLKFERNYKDGKKNGLCRTWRENGRLKFERNYKDGMLVSEKEFDYNGNPM